MHTGSIDSFTADYSRYTEAELHMLGGYLQPRSTSGHELP